MSVSVFAGLGNPGKPYEETRHNVGFQVLDAYARKKEFSWEVDKKLNCHLAILKRESRACYFVKPNTFVNLSGDCLQKVARYYKIPVDEIVVVYDDIGLEMGRLKINQEGGPGGHNGIEDVIRKLGANFIRFRVGIGTKYPPEIDLANFVLGKLSKSEADVIKNQMDTYHQAMELLLSRGPTIAMNQFNQSKLKHDADKTHL